MKVAGCSSSGGVGLSYSISINLILKVLVASPSKVIIKLPSSKDMITLSWDFARLRTLMNSPVSILIFSGTSQTYSSNKLAFNSKCTNVIWLRSKASNLIPSLSVWICTSSTIDEIASKLVFNILESLNSALNIYNPLIRIY